MKTIKSVEYRGLKIGLEQDEIKFESEAVPTYWLTVNNKRVQLFFDYNIADIEFDKTVELAMGE